MARRLQRDDVEKFFDYGLDIPTRTIYMGGMNSHHHEGIDHVIAEHLIKSLHLLDKYDATGEKPITIIMNSDGGEWTDGMAIYDAIKECNNHITIKVYGSAMSMGSIILQAADTRIMSPNSTFMIHYGHSVLEDHVKNNLRWSEEEKRTMKIMEDIYLTKIREKHPNFRRDRVKKMLDFDTILTAQQAVDLGLADEVK